MSFFNIEIENLNFISNTDETIPEESLSTWSSSNTQREAKASHSVGVFKHMLGVLCSSLRCVRLRMFSAIAPLAILAQVSDNFPYKIWDR